MEKEISIGGILIFDGTVQEIFDQVAASMGISTYLELRDLWILGIKKVVGGV